MIESVEKLEGRTIYWFGGKPRHGLIVCKAQNGVTDELATQYDLANGMFEKAVDELERELEKKP